MKFFTPVAEKLSLLLTTYRAADIDTVAWLVTLDDLIRFTEEVRGEVDEDNQALRIFELGMILYQTRNEYLGSTRVDALVWSLLHSRILSHTAIAGDVGIYVEAIFTVVADERIDDRPIYWLVSDLLAQTLRRVDEVSQKEELRTFDAECKLLESLARLLLAEGHNPAAAFLNTGRNKSGVSPAVDLVFYDHSWGVDRTDAAWLEVGAQADPDLRIYDKDCLWRDPAGNTLGSPLVKDSRMKLSRFNQDVLINLACWQQHCQSDGVEAAEVRMSNTETVRLNSCLTSLWDAFTKRDPKRREVVKHRQEALVIDFHANYSRKETTTECDEWGVTKSNWLRRKEVITEGYAVRYWASKHPFFERLFARWKWIAKPLTNVEFPESDPVPNQLPMIPVLSWLAGCEISKLDQGILENWWKRANPNSLFTIPTADGAAGTWKKGAWEWITVGVTDAGKTSLNMSMLNGIANDREVTSVTGSTRIRRDHAAVQYFRNFLPRWQQNEKIPTSAPETANIRVSSLIGAAEAPLEAVLDLSIKDTQGGDYNLDQLWQDGKPLPTFSNLVGPRLQKAGAISFAMDCSRLLNNEATDASVSTEFLLLQHCDDKNLTGLPGTPIALAITQADKIGLTEPFGDIAELLSGTFFNGDESDVKEWVRDRLWRLETSGKVQLQFIAYHLRTSWWNLLEQLILGGQGEHRAPRKVGVFLVCSLYSQAAAAPAADRTSVDVYLDWTAEHGMARWKDVLTRGITNDFRKELVLTVESIKPLITDLERQAARCRDGLRVTTRANAYIAVKQLLNDELGLNYAEDDDRNSRLVGRIPQIQADVRRAEGLLKIMQDAIEKVDLLEDL